MASRAPERVGPYRLIKPLGKGQIFEVWEVERVGERLAMKLLLPGDRHTRENIHSLKREASIALALKHPCVIETREFTSGSGGTYMIQELFRGSNLKERIQAGASRLAHRVEEIIKNAATGLKYLHEAGWIHRDVKPDNFLVSDDARVKLIDFNIAQRRPGLLGRLIPGRKKIQGTQSYMSPEQIRGEPADERSDIYSFGCLIYELISGKPPFTGVTSAELLNKHLKSRPPALVAPEHEVNSSLVRLAQRMISKDPASRPAGMSQFLEEFAGLRVFPGLPSQPTVPAPDSEAM